MQENEKTTVPIPSVGADGEQSLSYVTNEIITTGNEEINPIDESMEEMLRQMQRMSDPSYLATMTMSQLYDTVYESRLPVIDGLLYPGTYLFVGAPKVGKSFLMAQIAYHVSTGLPLWNYSIHAGTVLYLALEDDYRRLQERLYRMFGVDGTDTLHFATCAKQLGAGLYEQLARFVSEHRDTRLIIIDTLQKIREASGDRYSYASDYEMIGQLKHFADQTGIALLLVHHTRKQQADDKFDMISGTNGLLGAADGAFVLQKEKRTGNTAVLEVSGRDQPEQRLILKKDMKRLIWELEKAETELWQIPPDPILEKVAALLSEDILEWSGTPTELAEALKLELKPKVTHLLPTTMGNRTTLTILPILTTMLWNISAQSNITPTNSRMKPTSSSLLMRTIIKLWQRLSQNDLTTGKSRHNQENRNILLPSSETNPISQPV